MFGRIEIAKKVENGKQIRHCCRLLLMVMKKRRERERERRERRKKHEKKEMKEECFHPHLVIHKIGSNC